MNRERANEDDKWSERGKIHNDRKPKILDEDKKLDSQKNKKKYDKEAVQALLDREVNTTGLSSHILTYIYDLKTQIKSLRGFLNELQSETDKQSEYITLLENHNKEAFEASEKLRFSGEKQKREDAAMKDQAAALHREQGSQDPLSRQTQVNRIDILNLETPYPPSPNFIDRRHSTWFPSEPVNQPGGDSDTRSIQDMDIPRAHIAESWSPRSPLLNDDRHSVDEALVVRLIEQDEIPRPKRPPTRATRKPNSKDLSNIDIVKVRAEVENRFDFITHMGPEVEILRSNYLKLKDTPSPLSRDPDIYPTPRLDDYSTCINNLDDKFDKIIERTKKARKLSAKPDYMPKQPKGSTRKNNAAESPLPQNFSFIPATNKITVCAVSRESFPHKEKPALIPRKNVYLPPIKNVCSDNYLPSDNRSARRGSQGNAIGTVSRNGRSQNVTGNTDHFPYPPEPSERSACRTPKSPVKKPAKKIKTVDSVNHVMMASGRMSRSYEAKNSNSYCDASRPVVTTGLFPAITKAAQSMCKASTDIKPRSPGRRVDARNVLMDKDVHATNIPYSGKEQSIKLESEQRSYPLNLPDISIRHTSPPPNRKRLRSPPPPKKKKGKKDILKDLESSPDEALGHKSPKRYTRLQSVLPSRKSRFISPPSSEYLIRLTSPSPDRKRLKSPPPRKKKNSKNAADQECITPGSPLNVKSKCKAQMASPDEALGIQSPDIWHGLFSPVRNSRFLSPQSPESKIMRITPKISVSFDSETETFDHFPSVKSPAKRKPRKRYPATPVPPDSLMLPTIIGSIYETELPGEFSPRINESPVRTKRKPPKRYPGTPLPADLLINNEESDDLVLPKIIGSQKVPNSERVTPSPRSAMYMEIFSRTPVPSVSKQNQPTSPET